MNIGSSRQLAGENWGRYVDTSDGLSFGNWQSIVAVSASTINIAASNTSGNTSSVSLLAGQEIRGRFTSLTVVSGAVICRSSVWQKGPGGLYTSPSEFSYDDYAVWSGFGAVGSSILSGSTVSSNLGKTITFTAASSAFLRQQPTSWLGNFQANEYVVLSNVSEITFSCSSSVKGFGIEIQASAVNRPFTAVARFLNSSSNPVASDVSFGFSTLYPNPNGYTAFVGYQSNSANLAKIVLSTKETSSVTFGVGRLLIKT